MNLRPDLTSSALSPTVADESGVARVVPSGGDSGQCVLIETLHQIHFDMLLTIEHAADVRNAARVWAETIRQLIDREDR